MALFKSTAIHLTEKSTEPKFYTDHLPSSVTSLVDRPSTAPNSVGGVIIRVVVDASHHFSISVSPHTVTLHDLEDRVAQKWQRVGGKLGELEGRMFVGKNEHGDVWRVRSDKDLQQALETLPHDTIRKLCLYWV
jgi:hypothetical protein